MRKFLACPSGRIASAAFSLLFFLAAVLAVTGKGSVYLYVMPWVVTFGIVGFVVSVALATDEHPFGAMMQAILLPFAGGVYYAGLNMVLGAGAVVAGVMGALALCGAWASTVGYRNWA